MIFIIGITIAIFFELLLIFKKNKSNADKVLLAWLFLIVAHIFLFYINYVKVNFNYPFLLGLELPLPLIHGVMLYLYVATTTHQIPKNKKLLALHFIPVLVVYVYLITFYILPSEEKISIYRSRGRGYETFLYTLEVAYSLLGVLYIGWSLILLQIHKRMIVNQYSDIEKVNLNWLRILTWGMAIIWTVILIFHNGIYHFYSVVLFVFAIGFFGIKQIAIQPLTPLEPEPVSKQKRVKYLKSGLKEEESVRYYQELKKLMEEEKIFTQSELLINDLAAMLGIHPNHLSQIINEKEGKNFYQFINQYRIEEFKQLVSSSKGKQFTLLSLAFECGFNSKSSFNRYFKKSTGLTPSQYLAQLS